MYHIFFNKHKRLWNLQFSSSIENKIWATNYGGLKLILMENSLFPQIKSEGAFIREGGWSFYSENYRHI